MHAVPIEAVSSAPFPPFPQPLLCLYLQHVAASKDPEGALAGVQQSVLAYPTFVLGGGGGGGKGGGEEARASGSRGALWPSKLSSAHPRRPYRDFLSS